MSLTVNVLDNYGGPIACSASSYSSSSSSTYLVTLPDLDINDGVMFLHVREQRH